MSLPKPVNTEEAYMHAMVIRLDALCNMVSSIVEYIAEKEQVATVNVKDTQDLKSEPKSDLCQATTKAGNPCKAKAIEGEDFCATHKKVKK